MYGCFVTEPEDEGADLGVVFFHNAGYSTACGHGTIALVTWALETGVLVRRGARDAGRRGRPVGTARDRRAGARGRRRGARSLPERPRYVEAEGLPPRGCGRTSRSAAPSTPRSPRRFPVSLANVPELIELGRGGQGAGSRPRGVRPSRGARSSATSTASSSGSRWSRPAAAAAKRDRLRGRRGRPLAVRKRHLGPARAPRRGGLRRGRARPRERDRDRVSGAGGRGRRGRGRHPAVVVTEVEGSASNRAAEFVLDPATALGEFTSTACATRPGLPGCPRGFLRSDGLAYLSRTGSRGAGA